jgi:hypothetical protein
MGALARGFPAHPERYPDALTVPFEGGTLPEGPVREWLHGLDVVFSAETFYDWHLCRWATELGVATVCMVMPEFHLHHTQGHGMPEPSTWWAPTPWRLDALPEGTRLVPVPVALDRLAGPQEPNEGHLRVLHVAGHRAMADRNGTLILLQALRSVRRPLHVTITGQDGRLPATRTHRTAKITNQPAGAADYWDLYRAQDVLCLPRRYGGLCLPAQEAMAAGLGLVMGDCEPNSWWPAITIPGTYQGSISCAAGRLPTFNARPSALAAILDQLADHPEQVTHAQAAARAWAETHSWEALAPLWREELARAANRG